MMLKTNAFSMNGMSRRILKNSMCPFPLLGLGYSAIGVRTPYRAYRYGLQFFLPPVPEVDETARKEYRREHGCQNADAVHHGKTAHRPGAEREQRHARDQGGDVRVENRAPSAVIAGIDGGLRRGAIA